MAAVTVQEVVPGLVVHLDTSQLRGIGDSQTNAEQSRGQDRAIAGPHYFLIVELAGAVAVAVPLFSKFAPGSEKLIEGHKTGLADKWLGEQSYFSRWQHWHIPIAALAASSGTDECEPGNRRRYAVGKPELLQAIASWQAKKRAPFRVV